MKNLKNIMLLCFLGIIALVKNTEAQGFIVDTSLIPVYYSECKWFDLDNDNDLDIIIAGRQDDGSNDLAVYENINGKFQKYNDIYIPPFSYPVFRFLDYNKDGFIDLLIHGHLPPNTNTTILYRNTGNGNFVNSNIDFPYFEYANISVGDYNNDGDDDLFFTGRGEGTSYKTELSENVGGKKFVLVENDFIDINTASHAWGDYDNDGDLDIIMAGYNGSAVTKIYKNNGYGQFSDELLYVYSVQNGSVNWGDIDQDGDLDIFIMGNNGVKGITKIYKNKEGSYFDEFATLIGVSIGDSKLADMDNDGDLDVVYCGYNDGSREARYYRNDSTEGFYLLYNSIHKAWRSSVDLGDYDNDSDMDILLSGDGSSAFSKVFYNTIASTDTNLPPQRPSGLHSHVNKDSVFFSWNPATDDHTRSDGLTYNIRIGTSPNGIDVVSPLSDVNTGYHRVPQMGNVQLDTFAYYFLPVGKYYWSVQAIDNNYAGSEFAIEDSFTVSPSAMFLVSSDTLCAKEQIQLFAIGITGENTNYTWCFDDDTITGGDKDTIYRSFTLPGKHYITLKVMVNGVSDVYSDSVYVYSSPSFTLGNDRYVCINKMLKLEPTITGGILEYEYIWNTGDKTTQLSVNATAPQTYSLTVTDQNGCSFSDDVFLQPTSVPAEKNICMVRVDPELNKNMVVIDKSPSPAIAFYKIYKENVKANYELIGTINDDSTNIFVDMFSEPKIQAEKYKISAIDTCGNESALSSFHQTIHLNINEAVGGGANLIWNHYLDELQGIAFGFDGTGTYLIYRGTNPDSLSLHHTLSISNNSWTDPDDDKTYHYRIAVERKSLCDPNRLKASAGPFSQSLSNLEDNRLKGNAIDNNLAKSINLQIYPNPFRKQATIAYTLQKEAGVALDVFNVMGEKVATIVESSQAPGDYMYRYNPDKPGVYYLQFRIEGNMVVRKIIGL